MCLVAPGFRRLEQVHAEQCRHGMCGGRDRCTCERGEGLQGERPQPGAAVQAKDPGRRGAGHRQRQVAHLEGRTNGGVADGQLGQPALLAGEQRIKLADAPARLRCQPAGRDAYRQRQPAAGREDALGARRVRRRPRRARDRYEQCMRMRAVERAQRRDPGPGQIGQRGPAGHQDRGTARAGKQRPYLSRALRVVQHEHLPLRHHGAVPCRAFVIAGRDVRVWHAEVAEHPGQNVEGGLVTGRATQPDEQLPIGEGAGHLVSQMHGERGLADATRAGDRGDRDRAGGRPEVSRSRSSPVSAVLPVKSSRSAGSCRGMPVGRGSDELSADSANV